MVPSTNPTRIFALEPVSTMSSEKIAAVRLRGCVALPRVTLAPPCNSRTVPAGAPCAHTAAPFDASPSASSAARIVPRIKRVPRLVLSWIVRLFRAPGFDELFQVRVWLLGQRDLERHILVAGR